jgi:CRP/FNR family cyclic AMP-dependent transcriptional regulator
MKTIEELLSEHPFFHGLDDQWIELVAGCAGNTHLSPGGYLFREGSAADTFYLIRRGQVAIEVPTPTGQVVIQTAHDGDVVGWSWLVPPYRWTFDARATEETSLIGFDGACLRGKCETDPALGYALLQRVVRVMSAHVHSARVRMLDLYGTSP